jgi:hypothetical protein
MSRHRSPSGRRGHAVPARRHALSSPKAASPLRRISLPGRPARSADRRSITIGLVAFATGAVVLTSAALVGGASDDTTSLAAVGPPASVRPIEPPPPLEPPTVEDHAPPSPAPSAKKPSPTAKAPAAAPARPAQGAKLALAGCSRKATDAASFSSALASAAPGDKICATGNMGGQRLNVSRSGTAAKPIMVVGDGKTAVKGITVKASNVVVDGFSAVGPAAPGIEMEGDNITMQNNSVSHPTGGDYDGLRFFGDNLKILNNRISDINPGGTGAHADCMQTFQNDTPSSKNVVISGNRCERVDNMCLMAEGPGDLGDGGAGQGESANWTFSDNYCDTNASQALMIEAIQNVTVTGNQVVGKVDKAFAFDIGSTGARVSGNKLASGISYEVGMDSSSRKGYLGPNVGGGP